MFQSASTISNFRTALYILLCILPSFFLMTSSLAGETDTLYPQDLALTDATISGEKIRVFLIAKDKATISSEIDGRVVALPFVMGNTFKKGDLLVELDSELAQAARDKAEVELSASQANLEAVQDLRSRDDATLVSLSMLKRMLPSPKPGLF